MSQAVFVITVALKQEIPLEWLKFNNIPVVTTAGLNAGILNTLPLTKSVIIVITGVGQTKSKEAAETILKVLKPTYVINFGTAGSTNLEYKIGSLHQILSITHQSLPQIELPDVLPFFTQKKLYKSEVLGQTLLDMEAYAQATVFNENGTLFSVIKSVSDYANKSTESEFPNGLKASKENFQTLFSWLVDTHIRVSVIIPTYNRVTHLKQAIQSVLKQTYPIHELIIVDDGSTDTTKDYLNTLHNPKIKTMLLEQNNGVSNARNKGAKIASGNWLAFLDSDDQWVTTKLEDQVNFLKQHPYYALLQSEEEWIRNEKKVTQKSHHKKKSGWVFEACLERCFIAASSLLIQKEFFDHYKGFNTNFPICEDYELWLRICRSNIIGLCPTIGHIKYAGHKDQLSIQQEIDKFRLIALIEALDRETYSILKEKIKVELNKKAEILISGATKRQLYDKAEAYKALIKNVG